MSTTIFVLMLMTASTSRYYWELADEPDLPAVYTTLKDCQAAGAEAMKHDAGPKPLPPLEWKCVRYRKG